MFSNLILKDNVKAREQDSSGHYHYVERNADENEVNSQLILCERPFSKVQSKEKKSTIGFKNLLTKMRICHINNLKKLFHFKKYNHNK